jgi:hypothetical protein
MEDTIDYKQLLRKYIEHVGQTEGTTFISKVNWCSDITFNDEEVAELELFQSYPYPQELN